MHVSKVTNARLRQSNSVRSLSRTLTTKSQWFLKQLAASSMSTIQPSFSTRSCANS